MFYYDQLNFKDKKVYDLLQSGIRKYEKDIMLRDLGYTVDKVGKICTYMLLDNPDIYWTKGDLQLKKLDNKIVIRIQYIMDEQECNEVDKIIKGEIAKIDFGNCKSDIEKIQKAYEWLLSNVKYKIGAMHSQTICSVFVNKVSVCMGISKAFALIMRSQSIDCIIVLGKLFGNNSHSWNMVRIMDKYVHVDVAVGYPCFEKKWKEYHPNTNNECICVDDEYIAGSHRKRSMVKYPKDIEDVLKKDAILVAGAQHIGSRPEQQDAIWYSTLDDSNTTSKSSLAIGVVCDGIGSMKNSGWASRKAVQIMRRQYGKLKKKEDIDISILLCDSFKQIDHKIYTSMKGRNGKAGTTISVAIIKNGFLYWGSAGDSRIYIIRDGDICQITRDHTYFGHLFRKCVRGERTLSDVMKLPNKKKKSLISFWGSGRPTNVDIVQKPYELMHGDIILLCSDGLTNTLDDESIKEVVADERWELETKADSLVNYAACANTHSQDNTSVVLLQYV